MPGVALDCVPQMHFDHGPYADYIDLAMLIQDVTNWNEIELA